MMHCGLLGDKLSHSYSPLIHSYLGDYPYALFEKRPEELENFLKYGEFTGINVTAPYKKAVIPYCAQLSDEAKKLGAVNTIIRNDSGELIGHNTDYFGFAYMLKKSGLQVAGKKVLVLGSGGGACSVLGVLADCGANALVISRSGKNNYSNLYMHSDARIIVNATPVGMYPNTGVSPISLHLFPQLEGVLDIVYNPARTQLLMDAEELGVRTMNGLWMLVAQAKEAAQWFTSRVISDDAIEVVHAQVKRKMQNIVIIGMPGCGKSTVGQLLADMLDRKFVDCDTMIEQKAGKSIPDIFQENGETYFRHLETEIIREVSKQSSLVIATGGGCVTKQENYPLLRQNGTIIWLQRDIEQLQTEGRPLSLGTDLAQMYVAREHLYKQFADHVVLNFNSPHETAAEIAALEDK